MVLNAPGRDFFVAQTLRDQAGSAVYVCRDVREESGEQYTITLLKDRDRLFEAARIFLDMKDARVCPDFVDCFADKTGMYAAFRRKTSPPLFDAGGKTPRFSLQEKLTVGRNLLEQMLMQSLPPPVQIEALTGDNLCCDRSLSVSFNYALDHADEYDRMGSEDALELLGKTILSLFEDDASVRAQDGSCVGDITRALCAGEIVSIAQAYDAYLKVFRRLIEGERMAVAEKEHWLFRTWRFLKKLMSKLMPVLAILLIVAAIGYMIYTIQRPAVPADASPGAIRAIGVYEVQAPVPVMAPMSTPQAK